MTKKPKLIPLTKLLQETLVECIAATGKTQREIAGLLGVTPAKLSDLIHDRRPLTAEMAVRLGLLFGTTPNYWLAMQSDQKLREVIEQKGAAIEALEMQEA